MVWRDFLLGVTVRLLIGGNPIKAELEAHEGTQWASLETCKEAEPTEAPSFRDKRRMVPKPAGQNASIRCMSKDVDTWCHKHLPGPGLGSLFLPEGCQAPSQASLVGRWSAESPPGKFPALLGPSP